jgi:hypothetical protein
MALKAANASVSQDTAAVLKALKKQGSVPFNGPTTSDQNA